jgi:diadenosine tetraphosphate (Ap4A) HIT family hydrolase
MQGGFDKSSPLRGDFPCYGLSMKGFALDDRLRDDTIHIGVLGLNRLLLMNDRRFPWLILVPQRANVSELHELSPLDQTMMTFEMTQVAEALKRATDCHKINVAALGNQVSQLHVHVIARRTDDAAWPGPVWGSGQAQPYDNGDERHFIDRLAEHL